MPGKPPALYPRTEIRPRRARMVVLLGLSAAVCSLTPNTAAPVAASSRSWSNSAGLVDAAESIDTTFGPRTAVPQTPCRPKDRPETDLQGRIPPTDRLTGRAAEGYICNLDLIGNFRQPAYSTLDSFQNCAYYGLDTQTGAAQVLDVSDPSHPRATARLTTKAMENSGESLRVNAKRKLLISTGYTNSAGSTFNDAGKGNAPWLDIYDLSGNCRRPRLISSTEMTPAMGHEGWFAPDGRTYFMSTCCTGDIPTTFPIDISNPRKPRLLYAWNHHKAASHGGYTTEDNRRTYVCRQSAPPNDAVMTYGTSLRPRPFATKPRLLSTLPLEDNQFCQSVYRLTYNGTPYLLQFGERSGASPVTPTCERAADGWATFGYPRFIDISDERHPRIISRLLLEVDLPQHCPEVATEGSPLGFGYSVHHCSPDRLNNPTIMACSYFHGGMRVFDIRHPRRPREIAYYNPGLNSIYGTASRPVIRSDRREIWMTNDVTGFAVLKLPRTIWPFPDARRCPSRADYYFKQYNPDSTCRTASFAAIPAP